MNDYGQFSSNDSKLRMEPTDRYGSKSLAGLRAIQHKLKRFLATEEGLVRDLLIPGVLGTGSGALTMLTIYYLQTPEVETALVGTVAPLALALYLGRRYRRSRL